ncbi:M20/M25/M40 family metallo-hydrolase [Patescibacteria group bacterium]|nr:M20/M25/M40 family metallo-hydrolase [Patescibacteria group bacterium]
MSSSSRTEDEARELAGELDRFWEEQILSTLARFVRIPNQSPQFNATWDDVKATDDAVELLASWARRQTEQIPGSKVEIIRLDKDASETVQRTPLLVVEIPGIGPRASETVVLYGHADKQPPMEGWREGLGPRRSVREGNKLYGRGAADDGYAVFAAVAAIMANHKRGLPRARHIILIEFSEESGSRDLPFYMEHLADWIGTPSLVICLDSGAGDYDRLWVTTSLRGTLGYKLTVKVLAEPVHSGTAGGITPDPVMIVYELLSRVGYHNRVVTTLSETPPDDRLSQIDQTARVLGDKICDQLGLLPGVKPLGRSTRNLILANTWGTDVRIIGQSGLPPIEQAGNVALDQFAVQLSIRLPPTLPLEKARRVIESLLTKDPPYGVTIDLEFRKGGAGWNSLPLASWLDQVLMSASTAHFGQPYCAMGEGGSIPFMGLLGERFPETQFVVTGVLGPGSNAHGPNEMLDLSYAKRLTAAVADILTAHAMR